MENFMIIIFIIAASTVAFTLILYRYFPDKAIIKYLPAITSLFMGIGCLMKAQFFSDQMETLAFQVLAAISFISSALAFITAGTIDLTRRKQFKKNTDKKILRRI